MIAGGGSGISPVVMRGATGLAAEKFWPGGVSSPDADRMRDGLLQQREEEEAERKNEMERAKIRGGRAPAAKGAKGKGIGTNKRGVAASSTRAARH